MTPLLLHNATLIDGTGAEPRAGLSVAVRDGHIAAAASFKAEGGTRVIDCSERFMLTGLTDVCRVHN
jgi:N-acyl-D-aspartate/D-glutamate deacylase